MDAELRARIERQCADLIVALVHHYDHGEAESAAALFVPDGVWVRSQKPLHGHAAIIAAFKDSERTILRHFTSNIKVTVETAERATAVTYYAAYVHRSADGIPVLPAPLDHAVSIGEWRDTFVLTAEGWRFLRRDGSRIFQR